MSLRRIITPWVTGMINAKSWRRFMRHLATMRQRLRGGAHEVTYFHDISDPYSHLAVQCLDELKRRYDIKLIFHLVSPPADDAAPERTALQNYARKDAADIAGFHGVQFNDIGHQPSRGAYDLALRALAALDTPERDAFEINAAYWRDDVEALKAFASVSAPETENRVKLGDARRNELKHYLGGVFHYGGELFWGIDRLPYLEKRLTDNRCRYSGCQALTKFQTRPLFMSKPAQRRLRVEFYPSLRSPYSYLAMPEMLDLPNHYPVDVVWRPVMPMVMRGLPVPPRKGMYIIKDTVREAERIGVPFGRISDPLGTPVLRGYSLYPFAASKNREGEYLHAFCQLAWAEGEDMGRETGLRKAITRAGLDWDEAHPHLDSQDWVDTLEANRLQLFESGLWGVPSFRLLGPRGKEYFVSWGRDRIWLLAHHIQKALI